MNAVRRTLFLLALLAAGSISVGCDDNDDNDTEDHDHAGGADDDHDKPSGRNDTRAEDDECASFDTEHLKLLNAKTDADVVAKKSAAPKLDKDE